MVVFTSPLRGLDKFQHYPPPLRWIIAIYFCFILLSTSLIILIQVRTGRSGTTQWFVAVDMLTFYIFSIARSYYKVSSWLNIHQISFSFKLVQSNSVSMTNCPVTVRVKIAAHEGKQDAIFKCARRKWAIIRSLGPVGVVSGGGGGGLDFKWRGWSKDFPVFQSGIFLSQSPSLFPFLPIPKLFRRLTSNFSSYILYF